MSLNPLYYGNTQTVSGATALDSRAILNIKEGYRFGGTIEYIDKGNYEIEQIEKVGAFDQKLKIEATAPIFRLSANNNLIPRVFRSKRDVISRLADNVEFNALFTPFSGAWGNTNSLIRLANPPERSIAYLNDLIDVEDFRIVTKLKSSLAASQSLMCIRSRFNVDNNTGYILNHIGGENKFRLTRYDGTTGSTHLQSIGLTLANNTNYYFMFVANQGNLRGYWGTAPSGLTLGISISDYSYSRGSIGLDMRGVSSVIDISDFEFTELGDIYTSEDILKHIAGMGDVWNLKTQNNSDNFSITGNSTAGSSWVSGISNGEAIINLYNTTAGQSWHSFSLGDATPSGTILEVVANIQVNGTSGNIAGIGMGNYAQNQISFAQVFKFAGSSLNNWLEEIGATPIQRYPNRSQYVTLQPDKWYSLKMQSKKIGLSLRSWYTSFFLENKLLGSLVVPANALFDSQARFKIYGFREGVSGTVTSFKNYRVSELQNVVDHAQVESSQALDSAFSRFIPEGYEFITGGSFTEIIRKGSSRGSFGMTNIAKNQIINNTESISNLRGAKHTIGFSDDNVDISYQDGYNKRVAYSADSARYTFITDQNVKSSTSLEVITYNQMLNDNRDIERLSLTTVPRVHIQTNDYIGTVGDTYLGLSRGRAYMVESFTTEFSPASGTWRQSLIITDQV